MNRPLIRPELVEKFRPWREVAAAAATVGFAVWLFLRGGYFFQFIGLAVLSLGAVWLVNARRQMRFRRAVNAPGLVEIDEGAIRYLAPRILGGEIPLRDLVEIRMLRLSGQRHWRLRTLDGQALLIPVEAAGADHLAHAFAALPGVDMGRIAHALATDGPPMQTVWTRPAQPRLT
ncbi:hypothetical protein PE067_05435 [Paracoccus sp. DMF-8]|uniref:hypothetical protein n=1 Tax=Paracoccus sp. DMF-8 TaxID=3019445 RepID=UPI0023E7593C|nr:hypothetical protein [Paracoccus sp. DMF-8]MDF3605638.1 hypothetical protein [Paracoccus sp. DMF-8]